MKNPFEPNQPISPGEIKDKTGQTPEKNLVPLQYRGLPSSELVEELWIVPVYADSEKTRVENERRNKALEQLRQQEFTREARKENAISESYAKLSEKDRGEFTRVQQNGANEIIKHIQGAENLQGLLPEEEFVLTKLRNLYQEFKKENPDKPFAFEFSREIDRKVYANLSYRLAFEILESKRIEGEQQKIEEIRKSLEVGQSLKAEIVEKKKAKPLTEEEIEEMKKSALREERKQGMADINMDLRWNSVDWEIGQRFDAHGLAKMGLSTQLDQLLELLGKGIDPSREFHTAPLEVDPKNTKGAGAGLGTGGGSAYKNGSFIVLSEIDSSLKKGGIKYVAVNDAYYDAVPRLQEVFPNVEFIRADQLPQRLREIVGEAN